MNKINKVTLIGIGAMGSFFAPRLYQTLGDKFRILAGGERKERLESDGVTINGITYQFPIVTPDLTGDAADLILVAVKDTGLESAITDMKNQIGEHTIIISVLNGVESEEKIAKVYGWKHILYSFMRVSIVMKNGVTDYDPEKGLVYFGEKYNETYSERVLAVKELFDSSKVPYKIETDMIYGIWFKFMANIGENMICAALGVPFGAFQVSSHANFLREAAMKEVKEIANKKGIMLGQREFDIQNEVVKGLPYNNKPSTLQDLEAKKKTEVEMFSGTVVKLGKEMGILTPVNEMLYHMIKVLEEKNNGTI